MNPAAVNEVVDARAQVREQGLKLAFRPGEWIPLKGIWFKVAVVDVDKLTLAPVEMTGKRAKEVKGG